MIAAAIAAAAVGLAVAYVALRLGERFLTWAAAHEEARGRDALSRRVDAMEALTREHDTAIEKLKQENRAAAMSKLGRV